MRLQLAPPCQLHNLYIRCLHGCRTCRCKAQRLASPCRQWHHDGSFPAPCPCSAFSFMNHVCAAREMRDGLTTYPPAGLLAWQDEPPRCTCEHSLSLQASRYGNAWHPPLQQTSTAQPACVSHARLQASRAARILVIFTHMRPVPCTPRGGCTPLHSMSTQAAVRGSLDGNKGTLARVLPCPVGHLMPTQPLSAGDNIPTCLPIYIVMTQVLLAVLMPMAFHHCKSMAVPI